MPKWLFRLTLALLLISAITSVSFAQNPVTFQVNMSIQKQMGNFNPTTKIVVMRGSFEDEANAELQDWKGNLFALTESGTPDVYTLIVNFPDGAVGTGFEYKFVIDTVTASNDTLTQGGTWEGVSNRTFNLQAGGQVLNVVYFNDQSTLSLTADVTFKADMTDLVAKGWFDPANDTLRVVGGFNNWDQNLGKVMKRELLNPNMLNSTESVTGAPAAKIEFKFRAAPNAQFLDSGWEMGSNHSFVFTGSAMTLDAIKPNIGYAGVPLPQDVKVKFTVDMRNATETYHNNLLKNVKGVWIKGDKTELGAWGGAWTYDDTTSIMIKMYDNGTNGGDVKAGDGIFSAEVTFPSGTMSAILYKYGAAADSVDTLNGGTSYLDNEAGFSVNHSAVIPGDSPTYQLPLSRFGDKRTLTNAHVFQVDMSIQKAIGTFDAATKIVVMRGSFENESIPNAEEWKGNEFKLSPSLGNADIYQIAMPFMAATTIGNILEYKFVIEDTVRYTDLVTQAGSWESVGNRSFTVVAGGDSLPVVFFNDQSTLSLTADVTFKADMTDLVAKGWFDPANDTLRVVGGFNNWDQNLGKVMKRELLNPNMLSSTESVTGAPAAKIEFKFRAAPNAQFLDSGWEMGSNHSFVFTGSAMTLDALKPNIGYAGVPLPQDVTVQFAVYTGKAIECYHNLPFHNIKSVWLKGDKPQLGAWGGAWTYDDTTSIMIRLYDDGATGGDQAAGDQIWTTRVLFSSGTMSALLYKYGIAADGVDTLNLSVSYLDNEAGFSNNHSLVVPGGSALYIAPVDTFGSQRGLTAVKERPSAKLPTAYALNQNYPNPFNPVTAINYDLPKDGWVSLAVYNVLGQKVRTLVDLKQPAGSYSATWDGKDELGRQLSTGVYLYRIEAGSYVSVRKMVLMK